MTLPINTKVRVRRHWLVEGHTGTVEAHREGDVKSLARNQVRLDEQFVPHVDSERCRRLFFTDRDLEAMG